VRPRIAGTARSRCRGDPAVLPLLRRGHADAGSPLGGVLRALVTGPARFSDIAAAIPGMTDKLLSRRLKDLEADGLVERLVHAGPPVRVEYRLTEKGDALSTILLDLNRWALKWIDLPADH
jgi:DNA-binding HxlR family transcriptional regulator